MLPRRLQDFIVVTVMTVLIWLYAEGANVQTYSPPDSVELSVALSARDMVITEQKPEKVSVSFKGAQAELDQLRRSLRGVLQVDLDSTEPGAKSLPMAEVISGARSLQLANVNITRVEPQTLELQIERLVRREVPVVFRPSEVQLQGIAKIEPATVTITAPASRFELLPGDGAGLVVEAVVKEVRTLKPNVSHRVKARMALPPGVEGPHTTLSSTEAEVTFSIGSQEETITLTSVPVWRSSPPHEEYTVEYDTILSNVTVTGPADQVQKMKDNTDPSLRVIAMLWLGSDELANAVGKGPQVAPVKFNAPPQFKVDATNATVRYKVTLNPR